MAQLKLQTQIERQLQLMDIHQKAMRCSVSFSEEWYWRRDLAANAHHRAWEMQDEARSKP